MKNEEIEYTLDKPRFMKGKLKDIKYKGRCFRDGFQLINFIKQEARKEVIEEIGKMIDETKNYLQKLSITGDNKIDRDAISLCALKFHEKLKEELKEKRQDEKM